MTKWHLITSEYPPQPGGVSDYTRLVAEGLAAAGDGAHVWCPPLAEGQSSNVCGEDFRGTRDVVVHREFGEFTPTDLRRVGRLLDKMPAPRRLLVQYVPHAFGYRSMNIQFCLWLWARARTHGDEVEIMLHEPFLEFRRGAWRQCAAAAAHRLMTAILLRAASRVWTAIPAWEEMWRPFAFGKRVRFEWLPVPSVVPVVAEAATTARALYAPEGNSLIGHFGTYGRTIAQSLLRLVPALLSNDERQTRRVLLMGRGSETMRGELIRAHPALATHVYATGTLAPDDLSRHLRACDLLVQPYPDGVSTRRTSAMAGLAHGLPVITTRGRLTEDFWAKSGAVALVAAGDIAAMAATARRLLADPSETRRLSAAARSLYEAQFDLRRTIAALRNNDPTCTPSDAAVIDAETELHTS